MSTMEKLTFRPPVDTSKPGVNFRERKQRSGAVFYYLDVGGRPRREIPLGCDYTEAVKRYWYLNGQASTYAVAEPAFHLYRHFDGAGILLYVGISLSAINRLEAHRKTSPWFWNIARVEVQRFPTREQCEHAEKTAIDTERPLFNLRHAHATRKADAHQLRGAQQAKALILTDV